jgi:hypothetical protein
MSNLVRYRAMESLCRQKAVFRPQESWRLLAEAEMWHHKAEEEMVQEMASRPRGHSEASPDAVGSVTPKQLGDDLLLAS